ncbi:reverse transcriptase [Lasius niger]|uniref:Reverse transcriptase n=1 Tax=Lasius niger TaxID=67767 RepID=A0A0J7KI01_LASNI|nr:reverse transcriptase [Lasius niger]
MAMKEGKIGVKAMTAGVPQGSIMGPLLWNIAYDYVLDVFKEPGCSVLCYADDTLVIATAKNRRDLVGKANLQTSLVTKRIRELGLRVSARKTEAIVFLGRRTRLADPIRIIMEEEQITAESPVCSQCGEGPDTADHTLRDCVTWAGERLEQKGRIGQDLSLSVIIEKVLGDEEAWLAVKTFARSVMLAKEEEEKERERRGADEDTDAGGGVSPLRGAATESD